MQNFINDNIRVLYSIIALLLFTPMVSANNSIVLLVEQPKIENLPLTIATSQSALQNFTKKDGSDAEIAVISYSTTADVVQAFSPLTNDTSKEISSSLKTLGPRSKDINTASGMERAIALLNTQAQDNNKKILLVVSDANISTGDSELDSQFTEWLTEIISEDAVKSEIDVSWHPITENANHNNIDTFLERLNGRRVVVSPEPELIDQAALPKTPSQAEQQLEIITEKIANESDAIPPVAVTSEALTSEQPATLDQPITVQTEAAEPVEEVVASIDVQQATEDVTETVVEQSPIEDLTPSTIEQATIEEQKTSVDDLITPIELEQIENSNTADPSTVIVDQVTDSPAEGLLTPTNIKIAVLVIIALAATFLLKTLLSKRRDSEVTGTGLADKEYRDSGENSVVASATAAVSTKANAPIIPPRAPESAAPMSAEPVTPEPPPKPLTESTNNAAELLEPEDAMDATQEVFPEFSSASLTAASPEDIETEKAQIETVPESEEKTETPIAKEDDVKAEVEVEVDPYATVIAEAPVFPSTADSKPVLAEPNPNPSTAPADIDPYATVIADASQIKEYAKQFTEGNTPETDSSENTTNTDKDDPEKTVLYQPDKDR